MNRMFEEGPELVRPLRGRCFTGAAAAVADRFYWSRSGVRIALVVLCLLAPFATIVGYGLASWLIPEGATSK